VEVSVRSPYDFTIKEAGLAPAGRLWRWRKVALPAAINLQGNPGPVSPPVVVDAKSNAAVYIERSAAVDRGLKVWRDYVAWVRVGNGQVVCASSEPINMLSEHRGY
jgi:hypothetical protein